MTFPEVKHTKKPKLYEIQCAICGHLNWQPVSKLPEYTNCPECKKHRPYEYWELDCFDE